MKEKFPPVPLQTKEETESRKRILKRLRKLRHAMETGELMDDSDLSEE